MDSIEMRGRSASSPAPRAGPRLRVAPSRHEQVLEVSSSPAAAGGDGSRQRWRTVPQAALRAPGGGRRRDGRRSPSARRGGAALGCAHPSLNRAAVRGGSGGAQVQLRPGAAGGDAAAAVDGSATGATGVTGDGPRPPGEQRGVCNGAAAAGVRGRHHYRRTDREGGAKFWCRCMACRRMLGRGDAATYPENQEWPFAAFLGELLSVCYVRTQYMMWQGTGRWDASLFALSSDR
mmetsp:Transcript_41407/g.113947  ORF Transcript_41407/g.113947 Transcript_41407/m.113947 type:complete len:234 (+) Transcript_41407:378-1079(+)